MEFSLSEGTHIWKSSSEFPRYEIGSTDEGIFCAYVASFWKSDKMRELVVSAEGDWTFSSKERAEAACCQHRDRELVESANRKWRGNYVKTRSGSYCSVLSIFIGVIDELLYAEVRDVVSDSESKVELSSLTLVPYQEAKEFENKRRGK